MCVCAVHVIWASLSEPHIDRTYIWAISIVLVVRPSSARRVKAGSQYDATRCVSVASYCEPAFRPHEDQEVAHMLASANFTVMSVSSHLLYLSTVAVYISYIFRHW